MNIEYKFEELPILINGAHVGMFDGTAEIRYDRDGDWFVVEITLDGHNGERGEKAKSIPVTLNVSDGHLYFALTEALERLHADHIADEIREQLAEAA